MKETTQEDLSLVNALQPARRGDEPGASHLKIPTSLSQQLTFPNENPFTQKSSHQKQSPAAQRPDKDLLNIPLSQQLSTISYPKQQDSVLLQSQLSAAQQPQDRQDNISRQSLLKEEEEAAQLRSVSRTSKRKLSIKSKSIISQARSAQEDDRGLPLQPEVSVQMSRNATAAQNPNAGNLAGGATESQQQQQLVTSVPLSKPERRDRDQDDFAKRQQEK